MSISSQHQSASSPQTPLSNGHPKARATLEAMDNGRPRFTGCSSISAYEVLCKLGEGTFGEVHKARSKRGEMVALKKILMHNEKDGFPITALREIKLLKMLCHPNILQLKEMAVEHRRGEGRKKAFMYMVTPYMDHDLSGLLENPAVRITEPQIKCYMIQLLKGLEYLHGRQILHRDMKAANLLINNKGILQIADFGLARPYDEPPPQKGRGGGEAVRDYTTLVVTRWYRPPELLLQLRKYTTAIDMWGVGCVFGEMFKHKPILAGSSDLKQAQMIFDLVGAPTEENMPGWSELPGCEGVRTFGNQKSTLAVAFRECGSVMISLLSEFLKLDWRKRITAIDALDHDYFKTPPLPAKPGEIPQFEESHELDRRRYRDQQAAPPPAPAGGTVGMGPNGEWGNEQQNGYGHRRPPGAPPQHGPTRNGRDSRGPRPPAGRVLGPAEHRRAAWDQPKNSLPQKPPPSNDAVNWTGWGGDQPGHRLPRHGPPRGGLPPPGTSHVVDTYIPSYGNGEHPRTRMDAAGRNDRGEVGRHGDRMPPEASRRRSRSPARQTKMERMRERSRDVFSRRG